MRCQEEVFEMKGFVAVLIVVSLVSMPLAAVGAAGMRAAVGSLEFIPLIAVAPDDPQQAASTPPACTSPAPVHTHAFYHCYTPDQMAAAYSADPLPPAGITWKGDRIAVAEQSFNGGTATQIAGFDDVYAMAAANRVTIVSAAGDSGTANVDKQGRLYPFPTAEWPASDPLVTAAGGTWLQYGWKWNPSVSAATYYDCLNAGTDFNTCAAPYLAYTTSSGRTEAVWKEDWLPASTGGALSAVFGTPGWQSELPASLLAGMRGLPDLSWNAAVDGAALVYTTFPGARAGWHVVGGTSASTPQIAGLIALANHIAAQRGKKPVR